MPLWILHPSHAHIPANSITFSACSSSHRSWLLCKVTPLTVCLAAATRCPRRIRPLAVNVFNLVLVLDPTSAEGLLMCDTLYSMWQEYYPIRIGALQSASQGVQA